MTSVLIVDDDLSIRRLARFALIAAGYDVRVAGDGQEALDALNAEAADVVVLDLQMPNMDGRTLFRHLDGDDHRPPVLILSAYQADSARKELGADDSLSKPFMPEDLIDKVDQLTAHARPAA